MNNTIVLIGVLIGIGYIAWIITERKMKKDKK